jgi:uncharacterized protein
MQIKIDAFNHVLPPSYLDLVRAHSRSPGMVKRMTNIRALWDVEARLAMLEQWPEVKQVLTLGLPGPDGLGGPEISVKAARVANDSMADICRRSPERFPAFVASLPMNDVPSALEEMDRAVTQLGACGIQLLTNVAGRALDDEEFFPVFERITNHHGLPVWLHPVRLENFSDYKTEPTSRYEIWQVLGWPYETSACMARMVFSGLFDRLPNLRVLTHHCGGMIPYFAGRAETLWAQLGSRSTGEDYDAVLKRMTRPLIEYFRLFYGDTVLGGYTPALRCGLDFFGAERIVFASDCPFDPEGGPMFIREGIRSVGELGLAEEVARKIFHDNAVGLMTPQRA